LIKNKKTPEAGVFFFGGALSVNKEANKACLASGRVVFAVAVGVGV
jgi:hypothetical protein